MPWTWKMAETGCIFSAKYGGANTGFHRETYRSEKSSLVLKCRSIEDKMQLLNKQQEDSEKYKLGYLKRYDDVINDRKKRAC